MKPCIFGSKKVKGEPSKAWSDGWWEFGGYIDFWVPSSGVVTPNVGSGWKFWILLFPEEVPLFSFGMIS